MDIALSTFTLEAIATFEWIEFAAEEKDPVFC